MWVVKTAGESPWCRVYYEGLPPSGLAVRMRFAPTADGVAVAGIQVERTDGHAVTAADLRAVKLPPNWVLFGESARRWYRPEGPPITRSRRGPKDEGDERHHAVWDLWLQAQQAAPRAPVKWMLTRLSVSDATARRWVRQARERADRAEAAAEQAEQRAMHASDAADQAGDWAEPAEQQRMRARAEALQHAFEVAREQADQAEDAAAEAAERAEMAQDAADEAQEEVAEALARRGG